MLAPTTCSLVAWILIVIGHWKQLYRESDDVTLDYRSPSPTSTAIDEKVPYDYGTWWRRFSWTSTGSVYSKTSPVTVKVNFQREGCVSGHA